MKKEFHLYELRVSSGAGGDINTDQHGKNKALTFS
jgi:hypothetical protein